MCSVMLGEAAAAKPDAIPLSDNTVQRHNSDMASDVKEQVLNGVSESPFLLNLPTWLTVLNLWCTCTILKSSVSRVSLCFVILCQLAVQQKNDSRL